MNYTVTFEKTVILELYKAIYEILETLYLFKFKNKTYL